MTVGCTGSRLGTLRHSECPEKIIVPSDITHDVIWNRTLLESSSDRIGPVITARRGVAKHKEREHIKDYFFFFFRGAKGSKRKQGKELLPRSVTKLRIQRYRIKKNNCILKRQVTNAGWSEFTCRTYLMDRQKRRALRSGFGLPRNVPFSRLGAV